MTDCACSGTGWLTTPDGGAGTARLCPCQTEPRQAGEVAAILRAAGVGDRELRGAAGKWRAIYQSPETLYALSGEGDPGKGGPLSLPAWAKAMARRGNAPADPWLWLIEGVATTANPGATGNGKTRACLLALGKFVKYRGGSIAYVQCRELARWAIGRGEEKRAWSVDQERAYNAGMLYADDYGTHDRDDLDPVLSHRERYGLPTILTCNPGALESDGRLTSRLKGSGVRHVRVSGPDMRMARKEGTT